MLVNFIYRLGFKMVQDVPLSDFSKGKITAAENELKEEKSLVTDLLPK